jgi:acylphosphatase
MTVRAHIIFKGKVQGVWFRANTQMKARQFNVSGWVKNCKNGNVEAVFEGIEEDVKRLINWCESSQPYAQVTDASVKWESPAGEGGFRIDY